MEEVERQPRRCFDIREALLLLLRVVRGRVSIKEFHLRPIAAEREWRQQRGMWGDPAAQTT
jgi:hypothetical protein